ncbi:MAG: hypothetical protein AAGB01_06450 [Cyanobacteria bacterium P01_F01_bin.42]
MSQFTANSVPSAPKTHWRPVLAMALMQGAIILGWIVYRLYLPDLIGQFGFPQSAVLLLLMIEGFLAVVTEPLFGSLSDRYKTLWGLKAPFITIGVLLAAALFLLLPAVALFGNPETGLRWLFIGLVICWSIAMAVFRSPMLARLGEFACQRDWPYAASVLMFVGTIAGTLALPAATQVVKSMGVFSAFAVSSIVLLLSAGLLNQNQPSQSYAPLLATDSTQVSRQNLYLVALTGGTVTLGVILTRQLIGLIGQEQAPSLMAVFLGVQLITLLPTGRSAQRWGNLQTMIGGLMLLTLGFGLLMVSIPIVLKLAVVLLGLGMSGTGVATIPFAMSMVPLSRGGLGIGCYFGGAALAGALFNLYMALSTQLPVFVGWAVGIVSMAMAIAVLWISRSRINN